MISYLKIVLLTQALTSLSISLENEHPAPWLTNRFIHFENSGQSQKSLFNGNWKQFLREFELPIWSSEKSKPKTTLPYVTCDAKSPHYFKFFGNTVATFKTNSSVYLDSSPCFKNTTITANWQSNDTILLNFESYSKDALLCMDHYIITTLINFDIKTTIFEGSSSITYKLVNQTEIELVQNNGLKIIRLCDEWHRLIPDLVETLFAFIPDIVSGTGIAIPNFIETLAKMTDKQAIQEFLPVKLKHRNQKIPITPDIQRKYVRSGDIFSCADNNAGFGGLILVATGGPVNHSAIAMWKGDTLHVVEALSSLHVGEAMSSPDVVEATSRGLVSHTIDQFVTECQAATWHPLDEKHSKMFDVNKAWAWFENGIEGQPYGFSNLLMLWIDTPNSNYPLVTDIDDWIWTFTMIGQVNQEVVTQFLGGAMNVRLGTKDLDIPQLIAVAAKKNMTLGDVLAMPELEEYVYPNGVNYVCSSLATAMQKAGGVFDGFKINPQEFSPRDLFMTKIFEPEYWKRLPDECLQNDPGLPYCQIVGDFLVEHDWPNREYNSIELYDHMNDNCPGLSPDFVRPSGC